jgi:hypothetical protein
MTAWRKYGHSIDDERFIPDTDVFKTYPTELGADVFKTYPTDGRVEHIILGF